MTAMNNKQIKRISKSLFKFSNHNANAEIPLANQNISCQIVIRDGNNSSIAPSGYNN